VANTLVKITPKVDNTPPSPPMLSINPPTLSIKSPKPFVKAIKNLSSNKVL
jgi:hypothetical protein